MPIVNGNPVKAKFTSLWLDELSSVDIPAQKDAKVVIMKRDEGQDAAYATIRKYITPDEGAHDFAAVIRENEMSQKMWPYIDAYSQSIRSIMADGSLGVEKRNQLLEKSTNQFLTVVREISPTVEKQLSKLVSKARKEEPMSKTVEQLEGELATLKAEIKEMLEDKTDADSEMEAMSEELEDTKKKLVEATDEVIKVDDETEVRKSEVGVASFAVTKSLLDQRDTERFEKVAGNAYGHVAGTDAQKALVLKAREKMNEDTQKALDAILLSAEKMAKAGFGNLGITTENGPTQKQAQADFTSKVSEIAKRDNIDRAMAMTKARREYPTEFAEAYPDQSAN